MTRARPALRAASLPVLYLAAFALAVFGWKLFRFQTDDAFIAFRYARNALLGHGYVWNAAPFRPVEGYTSFLWVVLLKWTWQLLGIAPPEAADVLSLGFGCATLVLVGVLVLRIELPERLARHRLPLLALILWGTLTNRTFLAWLSSGLETALFNFCLTAWLVCMLAGPSQRGAAWVFLTCSTASLTALARPEGVLAVAATGVSLALDRPGSTGSALAPARLAAAALPLLAAPAHWLWRRSFYGDWLPNTYYAKAGDPWPESGLRYALSFGLEYALWIWIPVLLWASVRARRSPSRSIRPGGVLALGVLAVHFLYYTFAVGGDHFEYRIYSHLVPLIFVSFAWAVGRLRLGAGAALGLLAAFILASYPIPWVHYLETRDLATRAETKKMFRPIAYRFPALVRPYAEAFDSLQRWLISRSLCMRHQEHKVLHQRQLEQELPRELAELDPGDRIPFTWRASIGLPGWRLPAFAILDLYGLADRVVARAPPLHRRRPGALRQMAHDRVPPPGYLDCFLRGTRLEGKLRIALLPERQIRDCESRDWSRPEPGQSRARGAPEKVR